jgi:hypothetical protein
MMKDYLYTRTKNRNETAACTTIVTILSTVAAMVHNVAVFDNFGLNISYGL